MCSPDRGTRTFQARGICCLASIGTLVDDATNGRGEVLLQRLFSAFPAGGPGGGLLLLRAAAGATAVFDGAASFNTAETLTRLTVLVAVTMTLAGLVLIAGWYTPAGGTVLATADLCRLLAIVPIPALQLLHGGPPILLRIAVALALVMLGPGAHSIDAYLFGRREILISR